MGQEAGKARGNGQVRRTAPEVGVGSTQLLCSQEITQLRAQNDRNPEALATYRRK